MTQSVCAVIGVGSGVGTSISRKFSNEGYALAVTARSTSQIDSLAAELPDTRSYTFDVQDNDAATQVINRIEQDLGTVNTLVYNAGSGTWGAIDDINVENLQASWEVNTRGLFQTVSAVLPQMRKAGEGHIIVIGATASLRGGAAAAAFASAKAAQRSLAQSMARHLGNENIHVAYVIIDGVIDMERTREMMPDKEPDFFMDPEQIADSVYFLASQKKGSWTFELDVRPYKEKW